MEDLKQQLRDELEKAQQDAVLSPEYKRKKLIMYAIRTTIAIVLFYMLWEHQWVKWLVWIYIPLNLLFLFAIFVTPKVLKKKIENTQQKIDELDIEADN